MNIKSLCSVALGVSLAGVCLSGPKPEPGFVRIMSELDAGGDYLEILNAPTFQKDINAGLDFLQAVLCDFAVLNQTNDLRRVRDVRKAVTKTGFLGFRGLGNSVSKLNDSTYRHRSFVLTEGKVPLFDLAACGVRPWTVESYLPKTTALALSFSTDVKGCVRQASEIVKNFDLSAYLMLKGLSVASAGQQAPLDGYAPGTLVAVTLDDARQWSVPETGVLAPTFGLLLVQAVKGKSAWTMLKSSIMGMAQSDLFACSTLASPKFPEMERLVLAMPEGKDWNVSPACAFDARNGMIVIASSVELLDAALSAGVQKKDRLLDDPTVRASASLPEQISGFSYLSPKVMPVLADLGRQVVMKQPCGTKASPTLMAFLENPPKVWYTGTFVRVADGVKCEGFSSIGACSTLRMLTKLGLPQMVVGAVSSSLK